MVGSASPEELRGALAEVEALRDRLLVVTKQVIETGGGVWCWHEVWRGGLAGYSSPGCSRLCTCACVPC